MDQSRVANPVCRVSMSTADREQAPVTGWWRPIRYGSKARARIIVSVEAQNPAHRFRSSLEQTPNDEPGGCASASLWFPPNLSLWKSPAEGGFLGVFVLEIETSIVCCGSGGSA